MSFAERYGPWAVIAGASEGTRSAFAHRVAAEGVHCILLARRLRPLETLAEELRGRYGVECVTAAIDLATDDATRRMAEAAADREVGLFIGNAGADSIGSPFLDSEIANWESYGPVHNWGLADEEGGYAGWSAAARRQRILSIAAISGNTQAKEKPQ